MNSQLHAEFEFHISTGAMALQPGSQARWRCQRAGECRLALAEKMGLRCPGTIPKDHFLAAKENLKLPAFTPD